MMAEGKRRRRKLKPMEEAIQFSLLQKDKNGLDGRFISDFKGELNVLIEQSKRYSSPKSEDFVII